MKFTPEIKTLLESLNILNMEEKRNSTFIVEEMFDFYIKREIDCEGCRL